METRSSRSTSGSTWTKRSSAASERVADANTAARPLGVQRLPYRRAPSPSNAACAALAIRQTRTSPCDTVLDPSEHVFDLARPDVSVEETDREFPVERPIGPLQPRGGFLFRPEGGHGVRGDARDAIQAIGLVRRQSTGESAPGQGARRHVKYAGRFGHRQLKAFAHGIERAERQPLLDALAQLRGAWERASLEHRGSAENLDDVLGRGHTPSSQVALYHDAKCPRRSAPLEINAELSAASCSMPPVRTILTGMR